MLIQNHYPDEPFSPDTQREWVRSILELLRVCTESSDRDKLQPAG